MKYVIAIIVPIIGFFIIYFFILEDQLKTTLNIITISGTLVSLSGLILALVQIKSVRKVSALTREEIKKSLSHFNLLLSIADLTQSYHIIKEIINNIRSEKYELAHLRMLDLKQNLIEIQNKKDLNRYIDSKKIANHFVDLQIDINTVNRFIMMQEHNKVNSKNINCVRINEHLECLSTTITNIGNKLKYNQL